MKRRDIFKTMVGAAALPAIPKGETLPAKPELPSVPPTTKVVMINENTRKLLGFRLEMEREHGENGNHIFAPDLFVRWEYPDGSVREVETANYGTGNFNHAKRVFDDYVRGFRMVEQIVEPEEEEVEAAGPLTGKRFRTLADHEFPYMEAECLDEGRWGEADTDVQVGMIGKIGLMWRGDYSVQWEDTERTAAGHASYDPATFERGVEWL